MTEPITKQELIDASLDAATLAECVNGDDTTDVISRLGESFPALAKAIKILQQAGGLLGFMTKADLLAYTPTDPKQLARVLADADVNNGDYYWNGSVWTKSAFDPAALVNTNLTTLRTQLSNLAVYNGTGSIVPFFIDVANKVLLGYDTINEKVVGGGLIDDIAVNDLTSDFLAKQRTAKSLSTTIVPLIVDANNKVLLGYDAAKDKIIGAFDGQTSGGSSQTITPFDAVLKPISKSINHLLFYGQSLSVGALSTPVLSTTQPYSNLTFIGGPRGNSGFSSSKPLVEDATAPAPDGGSNRGETPCSGAANCASLFAYRDNGVLPSSHVIFSSAAGRGGTAIADLKKGSTWYNTVFMNHVSSAFAINNNSAVHAVAWVQGENDIVDGTTYASYKATLQQLQVDAETDIKAVNSQLSPVHFLTYQLSYKAATTPQIANALYDLTVSNPKFHFVTPTYIFPHQSSDQTHLTNVGSKLMGAYFGRAYKQLVLDGRKPDCLQPISSSVLGKVVSIKFKAPKMPLVLDNVNLAATTDMGFKILDGVSTAPIASIIVDVDIVRITLVSTPSGAITVRYGLDYLGSGLQILDGASGNLRDSTADTVLISAVNYPLWHVCPHFSMTALTLGI